MSFIVVFYNEEYNLPLVFEEIRKIEQLLPEVDYEIVFVDDGSKDNSWKVVKEFASKYPFVKAVSFVRNFGAIQAVIAGMQVAEGDFLVDMASDCQEPVELFVSLLKENLEKGYEVSWGVRKSRQDSFKSVLFSKFYYWIMRNFAIKNFPKEGLDAFCISKRVKEFILQNYTVTSNLHNLLYWANFESGKVMYDRRERKKGKSKWSFSKKLNLFINSFVSFSYAPLRFVTLMGIIFLVLSLIWTTYIIIHAIVTGFPVPGYATITSVLLFGFGITNFSIGVISEYIWRILENVKPKPMFLIREKLNINSENK
ncbi:MAG: glycosyltransferase family 2 protein [Raineya sp.]|nr:glycosyltransferase family 2 protein [Raineya sp.]